MKRLFLSLILAFVFIAPAAGDDYNIPLVPSKYLDFNGISIAVYESEGYQDNEGSGVLLIHGNTASVNYFAKFLDNDFSEDNRVVAVDLPGYGMSDDAFFYDTAFLANAIIFTAEQMGLDTGVLVGWSLGGDLALQAAPGLPNLKGIFTFGTAPVGFTPNLPSPFLTPAESNAGAAAVYGFVPDLTPAQIDEYVTAFFRPGFKKIPATFVNDGLRTDPLTRAAVGTAASGLDPTFQDEVVIAKNLTIPFALVVGTEDFFVRIEYLKALESELPTLFGGKTIVIPNTGHAIQWERPDLLEVLVELFVSQSTH